MRVIYRLPLEFLHKGHALGKALPCHYVIMEITSPIFKSHNAGSWNANGSSFYDACVLYQVFHTRPWFGIRYCDKAMWCFGCRRPLCTYTSQSLTFQNKCHPPSCFLVGICLFLKYPTLLWHCANNIQTTSSLFSVITWEFDITELYPI